MVGPRLLASTGDIEHHLEDLPPDLFDCRIAGRNRARVDVDQIAPAIAPAKMRDATLITGTIARPYGVPRPVVKMCMFIAAASCSVPQIKSLAGVAAKISPFAVTRSPGPMTPAIAAVPAFATEPSAFSTMLRQAAALVSRAGIRAAIRPAAIEICVVPRHLANQIARYVFVRCTRRQQMDCITHLRHFGKHHRRAGAHQQVRRITHRRISRDAGESVAAAALQADHQIGRRPRDALP